MGIVVLKFGGTSVADPEKLRLVAKKVVETKEAGHDVVVVVSAMGSTTNQLLEMAHQMAKDPSRRELDMLVTVGERISMALLSIAIQDMGYPAISLTGSQAGIITNASHTHARIIEVRPFRVLDALERGNIVIIAGYQGMSYTREITSLGRGGSDTTAVAMAAALDAERCEIYSDVEGVFSADPKAVVDAHRLEGLSYDEMIALARHGAVVLNPDAVEFARRKGIALYARSTFSKGEGTVIRRFQPTKDVTVKAVVHKDVWLMECRDSYDMNEFYSFLEILDQEGIILDYAMLGEASWFVLDPSRILGDQEEVLRRLQGHSANLPTIRRDLAMVSVVGEGASRPEVLRCVFQKGRAIAIRSFVTPLSAGFIVEKPYAEGLVALLHKDCVVALPDGDG